MRKLKSKYGLGTLLSIVALMVICLTSYGQPSESVEMADAMRANGKIYVVVGVLLIILLGFFVYLFSLDKKLKKALNE